MSGDLKPSQYKVLEEFQKLSFCGKVPVSVPAGHKDGWGLAAYSHDKTGIAFYARHPGDPYSNSAFSHSIEVVQSLNPSIIVGHLRKASVGKNTSANTHPFVFKNFVFCHNGSASFVSEDFLEPNYKELVSGQTDSEKLFYLLVQLVFKNNGNIPLAIAELLKFVREHSNYTSLNFIFTDGNTVWALREVNEDNEIVKKLDMCDSYYTLYYSSDDSGGVNIICSEPMPVPDLKWNLIANHTLVIIGTAGVTSLVI